MQGFKRDRGFGVQCSGWGRERTCDIQHQTVKVAHMYRPSKGTHAPPGLQTSWPCDIPPPSRLVNRMKNPSSNAAMESRIAAIVLPARKPQHQYRSC